jgi:hypothetical protein
MPAIAHAQACGKHLGAPRRGPLALLAATQPRSFREPQACLSQELWDSSSGCTYTAL